ncbi:MAG: ABC transporter ATP-binding protein/permease [Lachnospiraceae bacterium]|nr:ABC transporter ATP-binding protein/permease [Lachnospiraceae bacterium]
MAGNRGPGRRRGPGIAPGEKLQSGIVKRVVKDIFSFYPVLLPLLLCCIVISSLISSLPAVFQQKIIAVIESSYRSGDWEGVKGEIFHYIRLLVGLYAVSLCATVAFTQMGAVVTQGTLKKMRGKLFNRMETLPIRFFDRKPVGDTMSLYTNDIDALRQMISQSLPQVLNTAIMVITVLGIMFWYSINMTVVVLLGVFLMFLVTKFIGGGSARFFFKQQQAIGKTEGYIQETISGSKVVKVFCHEKLCREEFEKLNEELFTVSSKANKYANVLGPILNNLGNILYVVVAIAGGIFIASGARNFSISGMDFSISIVIPYLGMTRMFSGQIGQISMQVNSIVAGLAGCERIYRVMDEQSEQDGGYVHLVNVTEKNGELVETTENTKLWAWKHPHKEQGTVTYTPLRGDVVLAGVDFSYDGVKQVLYDVSLYAKPGQKVAFVGATGAGKTTITNLLNRFYDIADGKIRYDGININKICKPDLRHAVGIVLQDTNLFTATVMENIRYGRLDATDEECIAAAKLAGAHDFISHLSEGYNTVIAGNAANLSQGQRQLLSIARVAVADPPVMILDEATSSIDTRTEAIVQKGMDALMKGRTTFVIAHRLSTVKNSDVIIVLDHGRIIERGDHDELIAAKGQYYRLYTGAFELD